MLVNIVSEHDNLPSMRCKGTKKIDIHYKINVNITAFNIIKHLNSGKRSNFARKKRNIKY